MKRTCPTGPSASALQGKQKKSASAHGGVRRRAGDQVDAQPSRRPDLPAGYLIVDYAEGVTVIGRETPVALSVHVTEAGARHEGHDPQENSKAVKEVVRQLRLRDIGGSIVIDFIDMASPKESWRRQKAIGEELERRQDED